MIKQHISDLLGNIKLPALKKKKQKNPKLMKLIAFFLGKITLTYVDSQ